MLGRKNQNDGLFHLAANQILDEVTVKENIGWSCTLKVSVVEVYNDKLYDLLESMNTVTIQGSKSETKVFGIETRQINTNDKVVGLTQLKEALDLAEKNRRTARTKMNSQSSRSHCLFMLLLSLVHEESSTVLNGELKLFDLAGSECLDSGPNPPKKVLAETTNINESLIFLQQVFVEKKNANFCSCTLTRLVENCFHDRGQAFMIVHLSPSEEHKKESLRSLEFASSLKIVMPRTQENAASKESCNNLSPNQNMMNCKRGDPTSKSLKKQKGQRLMYDDNCVHASKSTSRGDSCTNRLSGM